MHQLPEDILIYQINPYLPNKDVLSLLSVCKDLNKLRNKVQFYEHKILLHRDKNKWYYHNLRNLSLYHMSETWGELPKNLRHVHLLNNKPLNGMLNEGILSISLGRGWNQSIENEIPSTVTYFRTNDSFNQPIKGFLSKNLKTLILGTGFKQSLVDCLNEGLEELFLYGNIPFSLKGCIPKTVKKLIILSDNETDLRDCIPRSVEYLSTRGPINNLARDCPNIRVLCYKNNTAEIKSEHIPQALEYLKLQKWKCKDQNIIPKTVRRLELNVSNDIVIIPEGVKTVSICLCKWMTIPKSVTELTFSRIRDPENIQIPDTVKDLTTYVSMIFPELIPYGIEKLKIKGEYGYQLLKGCIPLSVKVLTLGYNISLEDDAIPEGVRCIIFESVVKGNICIPKSTIHLTLREDYLTPSLKNTRLRSLTILSSPKPVDDVDISQFLPRTLKRLIIPEGCMIGELSEGIEVVRIKR